MHFISIEIGAVNRVSIFYFCINLCLRLAMNYQYYASLNLIVKWKKVNERRCDHPTMMMLAVNVIQYNWPMKWIHVRMQMINIFYRIPASIHFLLSNVKVKSKKWKKQKQYYHSNKWRSLKHFFFQFQDASNYSNVGPIYRDWAIFLSNRVVNIHSSIFEFHNWQEVKILDSHWNCYHTWNTNSK